MTELVMRRRIEAPREVVFSFLIERDKLLRWIGVGADLDARVGGKLRIDVTGGDVVEGEYLEIDPPARVGFSWGWAGNDEVPPGSSTVTFDLVADGAATLLTMTHSGLPDDQRDNHAVGWTYFFGRLQTAGSGGDPGPVSSAELGTTIPILEEQT
jgi:uncharacterized protein YndB with AHSA1/START domain